MKEEWVYKVSYKATWGDQTDSEEEYTTARSVSRAITNVIGGQGQRARALREATSLDVRAVAVMTYEEFKKRHDLYVGPLP